ncbi:MAG: lipocalin family protein [Prevotellaceae bacterium]|jgi:hypothetical protein|nr:lipocalin family protein [Prevotellaceae bacterium]
MKSRFFKIAMLFLAGGLLIFTSCSKEDENVDSSLIIGKWELTSKTNDDSEIIGSLWTYYDNSDNTFVHGNGQTYHYNLSESGDDGATGSYTNYFDWSIDGNILTTVSKGAVPVHHAYKINKLTPSEMKLTLEFAGGKSEFMFERR